VLQYAVVFPQNQYWEQQFPKAEFKHVMPLPHEPSVLVLSAVDVLDLRQSMGLVDIENGKKSYVMKLTESGVEGTYGLGLQLPKAGWQNGPQ
jgi:hypothetical protein